MIFDTADTPLTRKEVLLSLRDALVASNGDHWLRIPDEVEREGGHIYEWRASLAMNVVDGDLAVEVSSDIYGHRWVRYIATVDKES